MLMPCVILRFLYRTHDKLTFHCSHTLLAHHPTTSLLPPYNLPRTLRQRQHIIMATKTASASDAPSDINILLRALGLAGEGGRCQTSKTYKEMLTENTESADAHFDHRASHAHPFYMSPVFVAVATGTTPELHEEDEVRWNTALGCAQFDTKSIEILSPGIDGQNWAERVITYTLAIAGRQTHSKANDITQGPDSGQVFQVSVENLKKWITEEPHPDRERSIIIVGDQLATQCKLWLGDVGSSFHRKYVLLFHRSSAY